MKENSLAKTLSKVPNLTEEQIRAIISDEIDKKKEEKQEACNHSRSADLIDGKKGIIKCHDCGKIGTIDDFGTSSAKIPPQMQAQIDKMREKESK